MRTLKQASDLTKEQIFSKENKTVSFIQNKYCVSVGVVLDENENELLIRTYQGCRINKINKNRAIESGKHSKYYTNSRPTKTVFEVLGIDEIEIDINEEW